MANLPPVSTTLEAKLPPVSTGDTGGKFGTGTAGVVDFAAGVNNTGGSCSVKQELRLHGKISSFYTLGLRLHRLAESIP